MVQDIRPVVIVQKKTVQSQFAGIVNGTADQKNIPNTMAYCVIQTQEICAQRVHK